MKSIYIYSLPLFFSLLINTTWATEDTVSKEQAATTVTNYINALSQGDILAIKGLLGGKLSGKRENLLNNPSYSNMLLNIYADVEYEILDSSIDNENNIVVDVVIIFNSQETMKTRFIINGINTMGGVTSYKIIDETELQN